MVGPGIGKDDMDMYRDLAYVVGLRGTDSTGIIQGTLSKWKCDVFIEKSAMDVAYFLWHHKYTEKGNKRIMTSLNDNVNMLHVRAATLGSVSNYNAHPHVTKHLIGMHNGTLVDNKYQPKDDRTDSEMLFKDIDDRGIEAVVRDMDKNSAYALTWVDRQEHTINIFRNEKRPLYCCFNKKRKVLYWASEGWMLEGCAARNHVEIGEVFYFEPFRLYSFRPEDVLANDLPDWEEFKSFKPRPEAEVVKAVSNPSSVEKPKEKEKKSEGAIERLFASNSNETALPKATFTFKNSDEIGKVVDLVSRPKPRRVNVPDTGAWETKSAEYKRLHPRAIKHIECKYCKTDLNLVGQYYASPCKEDGGKTLICADCKARIKQLKEENDLKTVNSIII